MSEFNTNFNVSILNSNKRENKKVENLTEKIRHSAKELFNIETLKPFQLLVIQRILEQNRCFRISYQLYEL